MYIFPSVMFCASGSSTARMAYMGVTPANTGGSSYGNHTFSLLKCFMKRIGVNKNGGMKRKTKKGKKKLEEERNPAKGRRKLEMTSGKVG